MARRAKLLNQFAHLKLLQRCAVSCCRARASVGIIADALRKSGVPTLPTAAAVYHHILNFGGCLRFKHSLVKL